MAHSSICSLSIAAVLTLNEDTIGYEAIKEVGPGGHFFGSPHTLERYETAFYNPILSDRRNYETWVEQGSEDSEQRANGIWKRVLNEYEEPKLDEAVDEALRDFIDRRKGEIAGRTAA